MKTGLYIGRFQPFHLGHLSAVKQALGKVDILYIGIGSAAESYQPQNPFTAAERIQMIEKALTDEKIPLERFRIIPVPNIQNFPAWPAHVRSFIPSFEVVFTNSAVVRELFEKFDHVQIENVDVEIKINATQVREKMLNEKNWKQDVPQAAADLIEQWNGVKRIQEIN